MIILKYVVLLLLLVVKNKGKKEDDIGKTRKVWGWMINLSLQIVHGKSTIVWHIFHCGKDY